MVSPRKAEFLTHDPLGYVDLYNLYGFAGYDPTNFWDPFGLEEGLFESVWNDGQEGSKIITGGLSNFAESVGQLQVDYGIFVAAGLDEAGLNSLADAARLSAAGTGAVIKADVEFALQSTIGFGPNYLLLIDSAGTDVGNGAAKAIHGKSTEDKILGASQLAGGIGKTIFVFLPFAAKLKTSKPKSQRFLDDGPEIFTSAGDRIYRNPSSFQDELTMAAAKAGDPDAIAVKTMTGKGKYAGWEKMQLRKTSENGVATNVHYSRNPKTGAVEDFKFKNRSVDHKKPVPMKLVTDKKGVNLQPYDPKGYLRKGGVGGGGGGAAGVFSNQCD